MWKQSLIVLNLKCQEKRKAEEPQETISEKALFMPTLEGDEKVPSMLPLEDYKKTAYVTNRLTIQEE